MSTRKSHSKSRNGCTPCKKRRVKCDEQGPPCANCVIRKSHCVYQKRNHLDPAGTAAGPDGLLGPGGLGLERSASPSAPGSASGSASTSTADFISDTGLSRRPDRHIFELELMHRWSTSTYKSFCSLKTEAPIMRERVPQDALRYNYLMDAVLAVTALDRAIELSTEPSPTSSSTDSPRIMVTPPLAAQDYARRAHEYWARGRQAFWASCGSITPENHIAMFIFTSISSAIILVLTRFGLCPDEKEPSAAGRISPELRCVSIQYDNLRDIQAVCLASWDWLQEGPLDMQAWIKQPVPRELLDEGTTTALSRLHGLNEWLHGCDRGQEPPAGTPEKARFSAYMSSVLFLEESFARDIDGTVKGQCASWLALSYPEFKIAFRQAEPMALLIIAFWAVLVNDMGKEAWYARDVGKDLVVVITNELRNSPFMAGPGTWESLNWARQRVDLEPVCLN